MKYLYAHLASRINHAIAVMLPTTQRQLLRVHADFITQAWQQGLIVKILH